ncbi:MAG: hypothetical protein P4L64_11055 [Caulobacteraceae bacterium]|nr:hypothetical protein [Caulobacteraceae bacterium]
MNAIVNPDDIRKAVANSLSTPSEDIARHVLAMAGANPSQIEKSITTGTGLVAYDLQAPAKNLYPVNTPLIKSLPRVGGVGTATNWKAVTGLSGSGFDATGWVPEGQRAGQMSYSTSSRSAAYATIGEEDQATWEAISAGRTFEDVQATMTTRLLQKMMLKEEMAVLAGNASLQLGTPSAPTLAAAGSGATLPALTYSVIVVALTLEGYRNSSLANGVATTKTVTGADGKTFTINGGSSAKSSNTTQAVTLGQTLSATATAILGAVAYAWFVGAAGSETLQAITTLNSATFNAAPTAGRQAATAISADSSTNATGFDGLLTTALKAGSGAYVNSLATGVAGTGTTLTSSGHGSVNEIDTMLQSLWDSYQVSPSVLWVNSQQLKDIATKVLTSASAPLLQYFQSPADGEARLTAGAAIDFYFNPFLNGGMRIPIRIHPLVPPGTILGYAADLPLQYQSNEVPNVAEVRVRRDYYQVDWPVTTRSQMVGVYAEETLAVYAPFAMAAITNIAAG